MDAPLNWSFSWQVWDEAKRLRCEWYNDYEKGVTKPPIVVSDLEVVELNFRGTFHHKYTWENKFTHETSDAWIFVNTSYTINERVTSTRASAWYVIFFFSTYWFYHVQDTFCFGPTKINVSIFCFITVLQNIDGEIRKPKIFKYHWMEGFKNNGSTHQLSEI